MLDLLLTMGYEQDHVQDAALSRLETGVETVFASTITFDLCQHAESRSVSHLLPGNRRRGVEHHPDEDATRAALAGTARAAVELPPWEAEHIGSFGRVRIWESKQRRCECNAQLVYASRASKRVLIS